MKTTLRTAAVLPLLASLTSAQSSSPLTCRTALGSKSLKTVPTTTVTSTQAQSTETLAFQSTVTQYVPTLSISTRTSTHTDMFTDTAVTDVFTTTTTVYNVNTITTPTTTTTTTTLTSTTSSTSTTEMATTAGWQPIADTLNSYNFPNKRALEHPHAVVARALTSGKVGLQAALATSTYPAGVTCTAVVTNPSVKTVYSTMKPSTSTVYYAYRTAYTTTTIQSTSTVVPPDVSTTETSTYISQVTTTTSTLLTEIDTASTTTTSIIPGPTVWDACASYNIFGPNFNAKGNEYHVVNVANSGRGVSSNFNILADGASSAVDCCNSCQSLGSCETYIFRARNENCFLLTHSGETCANQLSHPNYFLSIQGADTGAGYVVGNGNCGFTYSGNSDGSVWTVDGGSGFGEN